MVRMHACTCTTAAWNAGTLLMPWMGFRRWVYPEQTDPGTHSCNERHPGWCAARMSSTAGGIWAGTGT